MVVGRGVTGRGVLGAGTSTAGGVAVGPEAPPPGGDRTPADGVATWTRADDAGVDGLGGGGLRPRDVPLGSPPLASWLAVGAATKGPSFGLGNRRLPVAASATTTTSTPTAAAPTTTAALVLTR